MPTAPALTLRQMQSLFALKVSQLIAHAYLQGYEVTFGEAWRPPATALYYADQGKGIANSLHTVRLAIDLNLFRNGKYLSSTEAHRTLGEWWEKQSDARVTCCWGGRFGDGNHYSFAYGGRK